MNSILVCYPGRFQMCHTGHKKVFDFLCHKFGADNVFITTSNKTEMPNSPFNFDEKVELLFALGIESDKIIQTVQPYSPIELTRFFDENKTSIIFAVSEKDMQSDPRFSFHRKEDGSLPYFLKYNGSADKLESLNKHGYIITVPTYEFEALPQHEIYSALELRNLYKNSSMIQRKRIINTIYVRIKRDVLLLLNHKLKKDISKMKKITTHNIEHKFSLWKNGIIKMNESVFNGDIKFTKNNALILGKVNNKIVGAWINGSNVGYLNESGLVRVTKDKYVALAEDKDDKNMPQVRQWLDTVKQKYPKYANRIVPIYRRDGHELSAEAIGLDRCFGTFNLKSKIGDVLPESKQFRSTVKKLIKECYIHASSNNRSKLIESFSTLQYNTSLASPSIKKIINKHTKKILEMAMDQLDRNIPLPFGLKMIDIINVRLDKMQQHKIKLLQDQGKSEFAKRLTLAYKIMNPAGEDLRRKYNDLKDESRTNKSYMQQFIEVKNKVETLSNALKLNLDDILFGSKDPLREQKEETCGAFSLNLKRIRQDLSILDKISTLMNEYPSSTIVGGTKIVNDIQSLLDSLSPVTPDTNKMSESTDIDLKSRKLTQLCNIKQEISKFINNAVQLSKTIRDKRKIQSLLDSVWGKVEEYRRVMTSIKQLLTEDADAGSTTSSSIAMSSSNLFGATGSVVKRKLGNGMPTTSAKSRKCVRRKGVK